jgi:DNA-binding MarR family transcriptional regulator
MKSLHNVAAHQAVDRLFAVGRLIDDLVERELTEPGMTSARAFVIWLLFHGGPATQRELSQRSNRTPRNVTGLVDALEADGFVTREPHPTDRRATLVTLTPIGKTTAEHWQATYQDLADHLFADLPPDALPTFLTTLEQVTARLGDFRPTKPKGA